uniref:Chloride channel protein n=1 Tax=Zooxanthella nutricula TaxID=1333877 RepID=A0A7S2LL21_9DINO
MVLTGLSHKIAKLRPWSMGSGIPELKAILQRTYLKGFMQVGMIPVKFIGLVLVECAGLPVGKEGPLAHISAVITKRLAETRLFNAVTRIPQWSDRAFACAISVGLCASFGVPLGGVLFAMEVVPDSVGTTMTYWACLYASIMGSMMLRLLPALLAGPIVNLLPPLPEAPHRGADPEELLKNGALWLLCLPFGIALGFLGAVFVNTQTALSVRLRRWSTGTDVSKFDMRHGGDIRGGLGQTLVDVQHKPGTADHWRVCRKKTMLDGFIPVPTHRGLLLCLAVAAVDQTVNFLVPIARGTNQAQLLWSLISMHDTDWRSVETGFGSSGRVPAMPHDRLFPAAETASDLHQMVAHLAYFAWKFVSTCFALSIPVPCGSIIPCYIMGALLGRAYLYFLQLVAPSVGALFAGSYSDFALIGATAFAAGVCRSFSVVITVSELVGRPNLLMPTGIASIVSIGTGNFFSPGFFEAAGRSKMLPMLHKARSILDGSRMVSSLMSERVPRIPDSLGEDAWRGREYVRHVLNTHEMWTQFPVVAGDPSELDSAPLIGTVPRKVVEEYCALDESPSEPDAGTPGKPAVRLPRRHLHVATQVPMHMCVREAQLAVQLHPEMALYVVHHGHVVGYIDFELLLQDQTEKLRFEEW